MTAVDRLNGINSGLGFKAPVRVATTANITLSGTQTIDGVAVVANDRVLVKNQTTASENGIWNVSSGAWTRAKDFDGARDVVSGTSVSVASGTVNAGLSYYITTSGAILPGTTSLAFSRLRAGDQVNVKDYGAVGDGVTDDAAAFEAVFALAITKNLRLFVPAGTYRISRMLEITTAYALVFEGESLIASRLVFDSDATGGIKITYTSPLLPPTVGKLTLQTEAAGGGVGINIIAPAQATPLWMGPRVYEVAVWGVQILTDYWDTHIRIENAWYPVVEDFMFAGRNDSVSSGIGGRFFASAVGIHFHNVQAGNVLGKMVASLVETGFLHTGNTNGEGLIFAPDGEMISVRDGLVLSNGGGSRIDGFHLSTLRYGIHSVSHSLLDITGILFLKSNISTDNYVAIYADVSVSFNIHHNYFWGLYGGTGTNFGVVLAGSSDCNIESNWGRDVPAGYTLVTIGSASANNTVSNNRVPSDCFSAVIASDAGTGNILSDNIPTPLQVIADGDTTFNAALYNGGNLRVDNTNPTNFVGFTGGYEGQKIRLFIDDSTTSLIHTSPSLYLKGAANVAAPNAAGGFLDMQLVASVWRETGRSF